MDKNGHLREILQPSGKYLSFYMVVTLRLKKINTYLIRVVIQNGKKPQIQM